MLLTTVQAAEYLGLKPRSLRSPEVNKLEIPWYRIGQRVMFRKDELDEYIQARKFKPAEDRGGRFGFRGGK